MLIRRGTFLNIVGFFILAIPHSARAYSSRPVLPTISLYERYIALRNVLGKQKPLEVFIGIPVSNRKVSVHEARIDQRGRLIVGNDVLAKISGLSEPKTFYVGTSPLLEEDVLYAQLEDNARLAIGLPNKEIAREWFNALDTQAEINLLAFAIETHIFDLMKPIPVRAPNGILELIRELNELLMSQRVDELLLYFEPRYKKPVKTLPADPESDTPVSK